MGGLIAYRFTAHHCAGCVRRGTLWALLGGAAVLLLAGGLGGCSTLGFYQQAVAGQLRLLNARQDVASVLAQADLAPELRAALEDSRAVLGYAQDALGLEVGGRYGAYVDLEHDYVVWNLVVTPVDSITPRTWCFPVAGCVSYRGYFKEARARANARRFDPTAYDTWVGGVPAYSTLGWFDDPLLSSFIDWPQPARAELLLHELAHGELYVRGDTEFNESFATFVAQSGLPGYLRQAGSSETALHDHRRYRAERRRFNALLLDLRERLEADFADLPEAGRRERARDLRQQRYRQAGACFAGVRDQFSDPRWAEYFAAEPNLARLSLVDAYNRWVGAFAALFAEQGSDYARFYDAARALGALDSAARERRLTTLAAAFSQQQIQAERDDQHAEDIECEALTQHVGNGDVAG